ncbi:hypothetical protein GCM10010341_28770 [Streptomyces noursei]|nr:hypothetical protein GCM10010341_28770 [Streptomyces noursei]
MRSRGLPSDPTRAALFIKWPASRACPMGHGRVRGVWCGALLLGLFVLIVIIGLAGQK